MIFKINSWKKLHKRICNLYEDLALEFLKNNPGHKVDFIFIITKIVKIELPHLQFDDAQDFVNKQFSEYKIFNVFPLISEYLQIKNPNIPEDDIKKIFNTMRKPFIRKESEHEYFLYFVISKILELKDKSISRAEYLIEIARGNIPQNNKIKQFGRRIRQITDYRLISEESESSDVINNVQSKTLIQKAIDAPFSFKILADSLRIRFENDYTQVHLLPNWSSFQDFANIAGCVSLAFRLHFDVAEEERTEIELKMRESLSKLVYNSEKLYEDCYHFITDSLIEVPRKKRSKYIFILLAMWVYTIVSDDKKIEEQEWIVGRLAEVYQNETFGYWELGES